MKKTTKTTTKTTKNPKKPQFLQSKPSIFLKKEESNQNQLEKIERLGASRRQLPISSLINYEFILPDIDSFLVSQSNTNSNSHRLINIINGLLSILNSKSEFTFKYYKTIKAFAYNEKVYSTLNKTRKFNYFNLPLLVNDVKTIINTCEFSGKLFSLDSLRIISTQTKKPYKDKLKDNGKKKVKSTMITNKHKISLDINSHKDGNFYSIDGRILDQNEVIDEAFKSKGRIVYDEEFIRRRVNFDYTLLYKDKEDKENKENKEEKQGKGDFNGENCDINNDIDYKNGGDCSFSLIQTKEKVKKIIKRKLIQPDKQVSNTDINININNQVINRKINKKERVIRTDLDVLFNVSHYIYK